MCYICLLAPSHWTRLELARFRDQEFYSGYTCPRLVWTFTHRTTLSICTQTGPCTSPSPSVAQCKYAITIKNNNSSQCIHIWVKFGVCPRFISAKNWVLGSFVCVCLGELLLFTLGPAYSSNLSVTLYIILYSILYSIYCCQSEVIFSEKKNLLVIAGCSY